MQGITAGFDRQVHEMMGIQITAKRVFTDLIGLICFLYVQGVLVRLGIDSDRTNAQLLAGPRNADGDFAAIGDEHFFNGHGSFLQVIVINGRKLQPATAGCSVATFYPGFFRTA